jgi:hypothetical protein
VLSGGLKMHTAMEGIHEMGRPTLARWAGGMIGLFLLIAAAFPSAGAAFTAPVGYKGCGSFKARYTIHVYVKHVSCRTALRVQKEYWLAPEIEKELVGPDEYNGYVRLKRFPGWRCTSGAMAGACVKGRKEAAASTFNG